MKKMVNYQEKEKSTKKDCKDYYKAKIAERCTELYKELYNFEKFLFGVSAEVQIYQDNKDEYEFEISADFEDKNIVFRVNGIIIDTKKFNEFSDMEEWLKRKDINYFATKYSDENLAKKIGFSIVDNEVDLKNLSEEEQYIYTLFLYKYILYNIYSDKDDVYNKMKDFEEELVQIRNKTNEEFLLEVRDDILNELRKDMNVWLFDNVDYD